MGNIDSVPILAQLKSAVEGIFGSVADARTTQNNFLFKNTFPVVSQFVSLCYVIFGKFSEAWELQKDCLLDLGKVIDAVPLLGHVKGIMHFVARDKPGGIHAMVVSSRSTAVFLGGFVGEKIGGCGPLRRILASILGVMSAIAFDYFLLSNLSESPVFQPLDYGYTVWFSGQPVSVGMKFDLFVQLVIDVFIAGGGFCCGCCGNTAEERGIGSGSGGSGSPTAFIQAALNNRANQLNPNNWRYWKSRGYEPL